MREFVIVVSSSSSSISTPPNPSRHHHPRHFRSSSKFSPSNLPSRSSAVRSDLPHLRHLADFAGDAKLRDLSVVVESLAVSGVDASRLRSALRAELASAEKGISAVLRDGKVRSFARLLGKLDELGFPPVEVFDGWALELIRRECRRILRCEQVEELVELFEVLSGYGFSIKELVKPSDVIKICVEKRKPKMAIRYACTLPHAHIIFCDAVYEFGKKGDLVSALIAYEASKKNSTSTNMYLYRTIIDVCGRCHDYQKSRYIYEDLVNEKVTPNVYVFNSLMNVNAHDFSYTLNVYRDMQNLGVQADMASYNILLKACCLAGRVDLAQDIYKEVQHLESTGLLKLDVFTYSTIVKVLADAKLWQMALKVKEDMLSAGVNPNTVTWSSLISACANAGIVDKTVQLFEEMLLAGCKPNTQCCNILLHACVEACQYDRAFRLFKFLKRNRVQETSEEDGRGDRDSNRSAGVTCISQSSTLCGLNFARELPFTPTTTTYNILMKACGSDYYHAKALIEEMEAVGLSPNQITWSILIDICGNLGNVEGALQILKTMRATGIEPDVVAYTTVIKVCVESKDLKQAFELFAEMKRYQIQPNLVTYNTLLRARNRYGSLQEVKQCLAVYQDMRRAGYNSNDYYLKQLIEEWCEGVIQGNNQNQEESSSFNKTDKKRPQSLLLEKVAEHLEKHIGETLTVDVQGLKKVEARIVVLAVLRMVKENYTMGYLVKDDMLIIIGACKVDAVPDEQELEVKDAITKLLKDELGLEVLSTGLKIEPNRQVDSDSLGTSDFSGEIKYSTRRPVVIQRLKVTKESLQHWLRRKISLVRNHYTT